MNHLFLFVCCQLFLHNVFQQISLDFQWLYSILWLEWFSELFFWELFHFLSMWWSWIKFSSFKVTVSNLFTCLFFIRFHINKYNFVVFILNSRSKLISELLTLPLHSSSACFLALLILILHFLCKVSLIISFLDKNVSSSGILYFTAILTFNYWCLYFIAS